MSIAPKADGQRPKTVYMAKRRQQMAKGIICDRCGAVITEYGKAKSIEIMPYCGIKAVNQSKSISFDLCKDCTETVLQYIDNQVEMVIFKGKEAEDGCKGADSNNGEK